jgi:hypothetical protein
MGSATTRVPTARRLRCLVAHVLGLRWTSRPLASVLTDPGS